MSHASMRPDQMVNSIGIVEQKLDEVFADIDRSHRPGLAVGVSLGSRIIYRKAFGLANRELPVVLSSTIRMRIGSISKHFAALTYLLLCEDGLCAIDDPIGSHLPELHLKVRSVTMRQLMGNNSGLRDAGDLCLQFSGAEQGRVSTRDLISFYCANSETNTAPGATHLYCNGGWILLSVAIERITGKPLEEVLRTRVFQPIGMNDTLLHRWEAACIPNYAAGHATVGGGRFEKTESIGGLDYAGAGAIASTVDDMLRWLAHMSKPAVGNATTWDALKTPQRLSNETSTGYGLGLEITRLRGIDVIHHNGGCWGGNAQIIKVPGADLDIIVICNCTDLSAFGYAEKILEACIPDLEPPEADKVYEGNFPTGVFRSPMSGRAIALSKHDIGYYLGGTRVPVAAIDGHFYPVAPDSNGVLRPSREVFGEFSITPIGDWLQPSAVKLVEFGVTDEFSAVPSGVALKSDSIQGRYWSAEIGSGAAITEREDGTAEIAFQGRFGRATHDLEPLAKGVWRTEIRNRWILPKWGFLLFDGAESFGFSNLFNRNIRFVRQ